MIETLHVLIVEDSEDDALLLERALRRNGLKTESRRVDTAEAMRAALGERLWDVVISDYVMPQFSGLAALQVLHESGQDLPFIMVSGKAGEETAVEAIHAGAGDYLLKDNLTRLVPAIERELREAAGRRERHAAEEELRVSEARFRATFEQAAVGMAHVGLDGRFLRVNRKLCDIIGYPEEELLQITFQQITHPDDLEADIAQRQHLLAGEINTFTMEKRYLRKDGSTVWVNLTDSVLRDRAGTPEYFIVVVADVTALHELQEQQRVFIHMVSHDLRSPLTVILGNTQIIEEMMTAEPFGDPMPTCIASVRRSAERLNVMIDDLTDAARIEGRQLQLKLREVRLADFVQDILQRFGTALGAERIQTAFPAGLPPLQADADRLERILLNLLSNATKYSAPGTEIMLAAQREADGVTVTVSDRGAGIAADDLPHIFERFYRATGVTRKAEGIGLGLYITRLLVEAHGGRIWVESRPGEGSTFSFTLPTVGPVDASSITASAAE